MHSRHFLSAELCLDKKHVVSNFYDGSFNKKEVIMFRDDVHLFLGYGTVSFKSN